MFALKVQACQEPCSFEEHTDLLLDLAYIHFGSNEKTTSAAPQVFIYPWQNLWSSVLRRMLPWKPNKPSLWK